MRWKWHQYALLGLAGWMIVSPWILGFAAINFALWNSIVAGTATALIALWSTLPPE